MTIAVAGTWDFAWLAPISEYDQWWQICEEFGVTDFNMCPVSGVDRPKVTECVDYAAIFNAHSNYELVFLDENAETELSNFIHPENALYIFGKGTYSPFTGLGMNYPNSHSVKINTVKPGMQWGHQALAIVLYDRSQK